MEFKLTVFHENHLEIKNFQNILHGIVEVLDLLCAKVFLALQGAL